jgi:hypothetical protein
VLPSATGTQETKHVLELKLNPERSSKRTHNQAKGGGEEAGEKEKGSGHLTSRPGEEEDVRRRGPPAKRFRSARRGEGRWRGERWPGWRVVKRDGRKDWAQQVAIKIRTWGGAGPQRSEPHHAALQQMDRHEILNFLGLLHTCYSHVRTSDSLAHLNGGIDV